VPQLGQGNFEGLFLLGWGVVLLGRVISLHLFHTSGPIRYKKFYHLMNMVVVVERIIE
jgi:hypothetical protein